MAGDPAPNNQARFLPVAAELLSQIPTPPTLYHYTDQEGFLGILSTGVMRATMISYLNDSSEYEHGLSLIVAELRTRQEADASLVDILAPYLDEQTLLPWRTPIVGVISFSKVRDDLSQWRAYAKGAGGVCIGFDGSLLIQQVNRAFGALVPVIYGNKSEPAAHAKVVSAFCDQFIAGIKTPPEDAAAKQAMHQRHLLSLQVVCSMLKDSAFKAEDEWRAIFNMPAGDRAQVKIRPGRSTLVPYYAVDLRNETLLKNRLPIKQVTTGPSPHERPAVNAAIITVHVHNEPCEVVATAVPFRNW